MPSDSFKKARRLLRFAKLMNWVMRRKVTPLGLRANMQQSMQGREPAGVHYVEVDAGGVPSAWLVPEDYDGRIRVLHLHGGGYTAGDIRTHRAYAGHLAEASGAAVLVADYRLAPEHVYPTTRNNSLST